MEKQDKWIPCSPPEVEQQIGKEYLLFFIFLSFWRSGIIKKFVYS